MPLIRLRHPDVPPSLSGWTLTDQTGRPRYWATVWSVLEGGRLQESTRGAHFRVIEAFYQSVEEQLGQDLLDQLLTDLDFNQLENCLESFFVSLRNSAVRAKNQGPVSIWHDVVAFIRDIVTRLCRSGSFEISRLDTINARLLRLERMYNSLQLPKAKQRIRVRALPALVIKDLYDVVMPDSPRNPFRTEKLRWRNFALILLLLHQGLRRSESLVLPLDAIKSEQQDEQLIHWIDIEQNPYEIADNRYLMPALKNQYAVRQIPISAELHSIIDVYVTSYRGKCSHSFLFASQSQQPLSSRSVNEVCQVLSSALSVEARDHLQKLRKASHFTPHDLRHTCAVMRLRQFVNAGFDMEASVQKLRVLFGWSKSSVMPQHYARAYFEERLASVWNDAFDSHVQALRSLE